MQTEKKTPQIVEWVEDEGIYPINFSEEKELQKTEQYSEVIKEKYPIFVEFDNKAIRGVFNFESCDPPLSETEKTELAKFKENQPPIRRKNKDGTVTYFVPNPEDKCYKKYFEAAKKRAPKFVFYENGVLSPIFFC